MGGVEALMTNTAVLMCGQFLMHVGSTQMEQGHV